MPKKSHLPVVKTDQVLILHIEFKWIKPSIWRRVAVPENITLSKLHQVIQAVFGWSDTHLHEFEIDGESYGVPDPDWGPPVISEQRKKLISVLYGKKSFRYVYDFGDDWELRIKVEKTLPAIIFPQVPCCIDGANRRPPEDIGGMLGYEEFLVALADPNHPEHEAMSEWYGDDEFDPTVFDCEWTNQWLKKQVKG
ncbi:plasmid pRiA4b ORF-3 family protein [Pseudomonas proteolytica]|uniref:plasmid pRiA4b ORF-3 family protein n=1 Tax=Pseudomonas proteolytica TaxID=219574 RepID=UPI001474E7F0|nr:plasmid pRiA4b ORF-3 family protein [Pseudomonas proteolytica]NMZ38866.1 plasmid pRiA4b ORF-3 family protein [Pseudomonas proteolytica]